MPSNKDLKRLVRARMKKTGESYSGARARIVSRKPAARLPADLAALAGMTDAAVHASTGKTWRQWTAVLDGIDAASLPHRDIAKHVLELGEVSAWWAQSVTVGYERIRGLREVGQRRGGGFDANKSKTFAVPVAQLYRAFSVKSIRDRWLHDRSDSDAIGLKIRTSTLNKSMRITWPDTTDVHVYFTDKGPGKSQVAVQHAGLPRKADILKTKEAWSQSFANLAEILSPAET